MLLTKVKTVSVTDGMMAVMMNKLYGTPANNTMGMPNGDSPVKNWGGSVKDFRMKRYKKLNPDPGAEDGELSRVDQRLELEVKRLPEPPPMDG